MTWKMAGAGLLALGTVMAATGSAEAAQGCGPGFHRGFDGFCRPNLYRPFGWGWHRPWHGGWGWRHGGWGHGWHHRW